MKTKKDLMTKKEYRRYLLIIFLLFGAFFILLAVAYILDAHHVSSNICNSLMIAAFASGFAMLVYLLLNFRRVNNYEKQAKEDKIDNDECGVIENFDVESLKDLLKNKGYEEKEDCLYKKKYSLIKDTTRFYIKFYDSEDLESTLAEVKESLDRHIYFTYSICQIMIISMNGVADSHIKQLKDITKKYKVPEEMLAKVSHYNNLVCFLVDKSCGKAYFVEPGRAKITTYAYGVREIIKLYK